jgi:hypothetical protein
MGRKVNPATAGTLTGSGPSGRKMGKIFLIAFLLLVVVVAGGAAYFALTEIPPPPGKIVHEIPASRLPK